MAITKKISALLLTLILLVALVPATVFAASLSGWVQDGDVWYYYRNDKKLSQTWLKWKNNWYYFGYSGRMMADTVYFVDSDQKTYVFDKSGALTKKTGWRFFGSSSSKDWFYVKKGGIATTGWKKIDGKWYYFMSSKDDMLMPGMMCCFPSMEINGVIYVFSSDGSLVTKTGWVSVKYFSTTYWFYVKKGGIATTGWKKLSGKWYYFDDYGPMLSNTSRNIGGKVYKFDKDGVCINP